jgi:hypothetical protein
VGICVISVWMRTLVRNAKVGILLMRTNAPLVLPIVIFVLMLPLVLFVWLPMWHSKVDVYPASKTVHIVQIPTHVKNVQ